jgi:hypothetical protein
MGGVVVGLIADVGVALDLRLIVLGAAVELECEVVVFVCSSLVQVSPSAPVVVAPPEFTRVMGSVCTSAEFVSQSAVGSMALALRASRLEFVRPIEGEPAP